MKLFGFATKYFRAACSDEEHRPIWRFWVSSGNQAAFINPVSGRVHAYVWHDGYGKYYPTIILPMWKAVPLLCKRHGWIVSLLPFPRVALDFVRLKSDSIVPAQKFAEYVLENGAAD
jgi:hypothetical protein